MNIFLLASQTAVDGVAAPGGGGGGWSGQLVMYTVDISIVVMAVLMFICIYRLVAGPHLADRALAVDTLGVMIIGLVLLLTIRFQTLMFFDGILVLSLLSFAGTVAMAQFIARPHMKKRRQQQQQGQRSS